ncbi:MAG TPA: alpha/beta hydrolase [Bacillota bacterium]|nr:alpha/beta hydrolase [Bacillota bacterium]
MKMKPHPGYEVMWNLEGEAGATFDEKMAKIVNYKAPNGMKIYDVDIPGLNGAPNIPVRVFRDPKATKAPLLVNIHGGGFVSGSRDRDNHRTSAFAAGVPCTVISVDYRLAPGASFPAQLEDCYAGILWAIKNADELGIDPDRIALIGTSAGAAITAGLTLYLRDIAGPRIAMQILNFGAFDYTSTTKSVLQLYEGAPLVNGENMSKIWALYMGGFDGKLPSYYAVPALCRDLTGLPPTAVVACEYDPLRDGGIDFARRLLEAMVPTELYVLPRVPHGYDLVQAPLTKWMREGLCASLRREFGMK